jgi:HlyD family secretion protein
MFLPFNKDMKRRVFLIISAIAIVTVSVAAYYHGNADTAPDFVTAPVTRGDIVQTIEATGTLQALTTVQVGTQVSGTVKALHADYNSRVRQGQVVAELEPSLFQTQVDQARASLSKLQADVTRAKVDVDDTQVKLRRAQELWNQQLIARTDLETAETNERQSQAALVSAEAQVQQGRATLQQADVNLAHSIIRAPIDGIVISRSVDVGQTVAASMQAPTLFVIAKDLSRMQVNASIDESDVGAISKDQRVRFTVDAYPGQTFTGKVSQVRLEPKTEQNVVTYIAVIDVPNPELKLKPGMTATVTVEVARADNVERVPNAALRFRPGGNGNRQARQGEARVWVLQDGQPHPVRVSTGISDGTVTAVLGDAIPEGAQVITAQRSQTAARATTSSPLLPFGGRRGGGAGGAARGALGNGGQGQGGNR